MSEKDAARNAETRFSHRVPRARLHPPKDIFPVDEWNMVARANRYIPGRISQGETLFAVSNGYLGMRGDHEEGAPKYHPGVFLNGFYETWPIVYGEDAYGFAKTGQTIVNVTDAKIIKLFVDGPARWIARSCGKRRRASASRWSRGGSCRWCTGIWPPSATRSRSTTTTRT